MMFHPYFKNGTKVRPIQEAYRRYGHRHVVPSHPQVKLVRIPKIGETAEVEQVVYQPRDVSYEDGFLGRPERPT